MTTDETDAPENLERLNANLARVEELSQRLIAALSHVTERIPFGTAIANLYTRHVTDFAGTAAMIHEISGGRFRFGIGVSHAPMNDHLGIKAGRPLRDVRDFVAGLRAASRLAALKASGRQPNRAMAPSRWSAGSLHGTSTSRRA